MHSTKACLGLRDGIMHLEGRVRNSSMAYGIKDGVTDLGPRQEPPTTKPTPWLIEINPRPPGMKRTQVIELTHGVDYCGHYSSSHDVPDRSSLVALSGALKACPRRQLLDR